MNLLYSRLALFICVALFSSALPAYAQFEPISVLFNFERFGDSCSSPTFPRHPDGISVTVFDNVNVQCHAGGGHLSLNWTNDSIPDPDQYLSFKLYAEEGEMLSFQTTDSLSIEARHFDGIKVLPVYFAQGDSTVMGEWSLVWDRMRYVAPFPEEVSADSMEIRFYGYSVPEQSLAGLWIFRLDLSMQATNIRVSTEEEAGRLNRSPDIRVYPNPTQSTAQFKVDMQSTNHARLTVYDLLGREVETLVDQRLPPGTHQVAWDATSHPNGLYLYRLVVADEVKVGKLSVLR